MELRQRQLKATKTAAAWCTTFRCLVIKPDTDVKMARLISGRSQARAQAVQPVTFLQTATFLFDLMQVC